MSSDLAQQARNVFAENFRRLLERSGKTQTGIASYLSVSPSTVSDWANGNKYPRVDKMQRLADYFGVPISELREVRDKGDQRDNTLSIYYDELRTRPELRLLAGLLSGATRDDVENVVRLAEIYLGKQADWSAAHPS